MVYIVAISAAVFLIALMDRTGLFIWLLDFNAYLIFRGEVWRLVTWVFCNFDIGSGFFGGLFFTVLKLYFYYFIGSTLEAVWGAAKFSLFFFSGVLINIIAGLLLWLIGGIILRISTIYIFLSMFFAFAVLNPNQTFMLMLIIPVKAKTLALFNAAVYIILIALDIGSGNFFSALLGLLTALILFMFCGSSLLSLLKREKGYSKRTVDFRAAAKGAKYREESRGYKHKCTVCGKTDSENPNLEFRYCSRCEGFHCYCIEHINNHLHFQ